MSDLLPPNASAPERAVDALAAGRLGIGLPMIDLARPDVCPTPVLEALAFAVSVDRWDRRWPEDRRRAAVAEAVAIHRLKGTRAAIRRLLGSIGYDVVAIVEGAAPIYHDGTHLHDGAETYAPPLDADAPPLIFHDGKSVHDGSAVYGRPLSWAIYRVVLDRPITRAQAEQVRALLATVAPARCHLVELRFREVAFLHDGALSHSGAATHGAA